MPPWPFAARFTAIAPLPPPASPAPPIPPPTLGRIVRNVAAAVWAHRHAALTLQLLAIAIGLGYAWSPPVHDALHDLARFRGRVGLPFALVSTAVFGGLIPWTAQRLAPATRAKATPGALAFLLGLWALKGLETDLFYRFQAWLFGGGTDPLTLTLKTLTDQGVYAPLWAAPSLALAFGWRAAGYRLGPIRRQIRAHGGPGPWYQARLLPIVLTNAAVWLPAVVAIYSLPLPLQLPLQNLVLCFWSILLLFLTHPPPEVAPARPA